MIEEIENISLEEWLSPLKKYQKDSISVLIDKYGEDDAITKWLTAKGPSNNVSFGGEPISDNSPFIDRFKDEFKKFICNHPDYERQRTSLNLESPVVKSIFISVISSAIGATIGFTATLLAPVIAIMLSTVGQIGVNAYCAG